MGAAVQVTADVLTIQADTGAFEGKVRQRKGTPGDLGGDGGQQLLSALPHLRQQPCRRHGVPTAQIAQHLIGVDGQGSRLEHSRSTSEIWFSGWIGKGKPQSI